MRLVTLILVLAVVANPAIAQETKTEPLESKISKLIKQLGMDQYRARERAQRALEELGLLAFDALHVAQSHDDIEIASRAKFLIRSMRVSWFTESDNAEVRRILRDYSDTNRDERRNRMDRLAKIEDNAGVPALCRIVRYETDSILSRAAALMVMQTCSPDDWSSPQKDLAQTIRDQLGPSQRAGAKWLGLFADALVDIKATLPKWDKVTTTEEQVLSLHRGQTNREIVRDLLRWQAEVFEEIGSVDQSVAVVRRAIKLLDGTHVQLTEMLDWMIERKAWKLIDELYTNFADEFTGNALLLYRLAEAKLTAGETEKANELAKTALNVDKDNLNAHLNAAYALRDRGRMDWCRDEFQHVINITKAGTVANLYARILISEIYHDFDQDKEAAEALKGVVDLAARPEIAQIIEDRLRRDVDGLRSRMNYFYALHYGKNDAEKAKAQLLEGIAKDKYDPDILIAMFRFPKADDEWKKATKGRIENTIKHYAEQRKRHLSEIKQANDEVTKSAIQTQLAHVDNQVAWLVSNTFGDFKEAIKLSHESLELRPNTSAYLDTLGRCYYADKDYDNAIKYQKQAVKLEPHSVQMKRQLKLFEDAKKAAAKKKQG